MARSETLPPSRLRRSPHRTSSPHLLTRRNGSASIVKTLWTLVPSTSVAAQRTTMSARISRKLVFSITQTVDDPLLHETAQQMRTWWIALQKLFPRSKLVEARPRDLQINQVASLIPRSKHMHRAKVSATNEKYQISLMTSACTRGFWQRICKDTISMWQGKDGNRTCPLYRAQVQVWLPRIITLRLAASRPLSQQAIKQSQHQAIAMFKKTILNHRPRKKRQHSNAVPAQMIQCHGTKRLHRSRIVHHGSGQILRSCPWLTSLSKDGPSQVLFPLVPSRSKAQKHCDRHSRLMCNLSKFRMIPRSRSVPSVRLRARRFHRSVLKKWLMNDQRNRTGNRSHTPDLSVQIRLGTTQPLDSRSSHSIEVRCTPPKHICRAVNAHEIRPLSNVNSSVQRKIKDIVYQGHTDRSTALRNPSLRQLPLLQQLMGSSNQCHLRSSPRRTLLIRLGLPSILNLSSTRIRANHNIRTWGHHLQCKTILAASLEDSGASFAVVRSKLWTETVAVTVTQASNARSVRASSPAAVVKTVWYRTKAVRTSLEMS